MYLPLASLLLSLSAAQTGGYPRADLLIEPAELAKATLHVMDTRPREKYQAGHVPGAVWVDVAAWGKAFAASQDAAAWGTRLGELGLDANSRVVVYGDDVRDAARAWWILHYWGLKEVRLLHGGWTAWQASGGPVSKDEPRVTPRKAALLALTDRLATKEQVLEALKGKLLQIIDSRSQGEHCGDVTLTKRGGAIPRAVHLEWSELLDAKTARFKTPAELTKLFQDAGIDLHRPAVSYCQSGGRAAVMVFALELMGAKDVRNYYRSWAEWGNAADTPIEKPAPKK